MRDLCVAALRFADPVDRGRVAHELADIAMTTGDIATVREALLVAVACGAGPQREHARSRLHTMARTQGDMVGMAALAQHGGSAGAGIADAVAGLGCGLGGGSGARAAA
jgi:hypothetical protein